MSWIAVAAATATNITFTSKPAGAGAAKSALFALGANNGAAQGFSPVGHFETVAGEGLSEQLAQGQPLVFRFLTSKSSLHKKRRNSF